MGVRHPDTDAFVILCFPPGGFLRRIVDRSLVASVVKALFRHASGYLLKRTLGVGKNLALRIDILGPTNKALDHI